MESKDRNKHAFLSYPNSSNSVIALVKNQQKYMLLGTLKCLNWILQRETLASKKSP